MPRPLFDPQGTVPFTSSLVGSLKSERGRGGKRWTDLFLCVSSICIWFKLANLLRIFFILIPSAAIYKYDLHVISALLKDVDELVEWAQESTQVQGSRKFPQDGFWQHMVTEPNS